MRERQRQRVKHTEREREIYDLIIILENFKIQAYSVYVID